MEFAKRLIDFRRRKGMSQADLAEALGVSIQTIQLWETASASPTIDQVSELASILGVSIDALMYDPNRRYAEPSYNSYKRTSATTVRRKKAKSQKFQEMAIIFLVAGFIILTNCPTFFLGNIHITINGNTNDLPYVVNYIIGGIVAALSLGCFITSFVFYRKYKVQKDIEKGSVSGLDE